MSSSPTIPSQIYFRSNPPLNILNPEPFIQALQPPRTQAFLTICQVGSSWVIDELASDTAVRASAQAGPWWGGVVRMGFPDRSPWFRGRRDSNEHPTAVPGHADQPRANLFGDSVQTFGHRLTLTFRLWNDSAATLLRPGRPTSDCIGPGSKSGRDMRDVETSKG